MPTIAQLMSVNPGGLSLYTELPLTSFSGWDRVWQIEQILASHDRGQFRESAMLVDAMWRDSRIAGVAETRTAALLSTPVLVQPADDSAEAIEYAAEIGGDDTHRGLWHRMFPSPEIGQVSRWGRWVGLGIAEILWNTEDKRKWIDVNGDMQYLEPDGKRSAIRWTPRLKAWHPQHVYWDWSRYCFMVVCREGIIPLPDVDNNPHGDGRWLVWTPLGYRFGWIQAFVRRLAHMYIIRGWNLRDWAFFNERHGQPIIGAKHPETAKKESVDRWLARFANLGSDAVVPLPQPEDPGTQGNGYDVQLIEAKSRSQETFMMLKHVTDVDIAVTVNGGNLANETQGGSRAAAETQEGGVRLDKRIEDALIAEAINDQVLYWDAAYNYGDPEKAPCATYQTVPADTEADEAQGMLLVGQAIGALEDAAPGLLDVRAVFDRYSLPAMTEEEQAAEMERRKALEVPPPDPNVDGAPRSGGAGGGQRQPRRAPTAAASIPRGPSDHAVTRRTFQGMKVAIENPAGSQRQWLDPQPDGSTKFGQTTMLYDYGFLEDHVGADGEELDVYLGPDETAKNVYVVHQNKAPDYTAYDEDKVMLGFADGGAAEKAYLAHRNDDARAIRGMSMHPLDRFKAKLKSRRGTGPIRASRVAAVAEIDETYEAVLAMFRRAAALKRGGAGPRKRRATTYGDLVIDSGVQKAARALAPQLTDVRALIVAAAEAEGDPFKALRKMVVEQLSRSQPKRMAEVIGNARLMADVGARAAMAKRAGLSPPRGGTTNRR